ncbi:hypothetical protein ABPG74_005654 [Tetrahymena malaccensis]
MGKHANKPKHGNSKRQSCAQKHKIEKKIKDHNKKMKKEAKKLKALGIIKKKSTQNVDLPNLFPFKKNILEQLERKKKEKELEKFQSKQKNEDIDIETVQNKALIYEEQELKNLAQENLNEYDGIHLNEANVIVKEGKKYYREMKKVLEASDILLEVLDARDPESCRCRKVEAEALSMKGNKKIILVLNKIDLVPAGNAEAWLKVLRREYATVLFKGNTQNQSSNLSGNSIFKKSITEREDLTNELMSSSKSVGADKLLELIKNYSKNEGTKTAVTVGVIGYPNVGKSSLINSLKRSKACGVSSTAGFTKTLQEVSIDSKVKIIDCPGVIFDDESSKNSTLLRNIVKPDQIEDPIVPVEEILKKVSKNDMLLLYKIADFKNTTEFLCNLALAKGKIKKGGAPNLDMAARMVIQDWNAGKIKYFTVPPVYNDVETSAVNSNILQSVNEMDQE